MTVHTTDPLDVGAPCIIHVNEHNTPSGWWYGIVVQADPCEVRITGKFQLDQGRPVHVDGHAHPSIHVNCSAYPDTPTTRSLVAILVRERDEAAVRTAKDAVRLEELRGVLTRIGVARG